MSSEPCRSIPSHPQDIGEDYRKIQQRLVITRPKDYKYKPSAHVEIIRILK